MSTFALVRAADRLVLAEPGVCVTCAGGTLGTLNQCLDCLQDCPVSSVPTVGEVQAAVERGDALLRERLAFYEAEEARWAERARDARAAEEADARFAAAMAGTPYAYEAWDDDAVYVARSASRAENWGVPLRVARAMTLAPARVV